MAFDASSKVWFDAGDEVITHYDLEMLLGDLLRTAEACTLKISAHYCQSQRWLVSSVRSNKKR